jgi:phosphoserine phosphatase RsbU/P
MTSRPWVGTAAVLFPLVPGAWMAWQPLNEGLGVVLLLGAVALSSWAGGPAAGAAAAVLAVFVDDLFLLPPRFSIVLTTRTVPHLIGFAAAAAAIVGCYGWVRAVRTGAERARTEAEERESALARRLELLGPMLDAAPIGFGTMDRDLRFRYANAHLATLSGRPVADHLGRTARELFGPEIGRVSEEVIARVIETGEVEAAIRLPIPWPDGVRHYLSNHYPVRDPTGWIIGVGFGAIDITEQVELENSYQRALAELTATIGSSPVAIALLGTDLCFGRVNREFERLAGDADRPLAGRPLAAATGMPSAVLAMPATVLRTGEPASAVDVATGPGYVTANCYPVRTYDGALVAIALIVHDVTEQHRLVRLEAETEALRATAELASKLEQAQRLAGIGNWELDLITGELTWSGQTQAIVEKLEGHFGGEGELPVHPDDEERMAACRRGLIGEGIPFADEFRLEHPDGSIVEVYCTGEAVRDESGSVVRVWGTFQDLSAQRAGERATREAIRTANQARAQLEAEHQALQMFVRAMLPGSLPEVTGAELAAAYLPVAERVDIGGDWYDSFRLPDGRLALAVGDVTGHDLRAATVMGQVRNAVRAYAFEDPAPGEVLRRTNLLLARLPELNLATMVYGVYDPQTCELTWANAGHPAPLLRHAGGVSALTDPCGVILGVFDDDSPYVEGTVRLTPGDTVLWFTDGLVDIRGTDPVDATRSLMAVLAGADAEPERLLSEVTERILTGDLQEDDVCLLVLHRAAQREPARVPEPP